MVYDGISSLLCHHVQGESLQPAKYTLADLVKYDRTICIVLVLSCKDGLFAVFCSIVTC